MTLIESHPHLGGRLSSYAHRSLPTPFDNGPHLFLSTYTRSRHLLAELGLSASFDYPWPGAIRFVGCDGLRGALRVWPLPSPWNLAAGLLNFPVLSRPARRRTISTAKELLSGLIDPSQSASEWLSTRWGEEERIILWEPLIQAALNARPDDIPATHLQTVLKEGFCKAPFGGRLGYARKPLGNIFSDRIGQKLKQTGVEVLLKTPSCGAITDGDRITTILLKDGRRIPCDAAVAALPPWALEEWLSTFAAGKTVLSDYKLNDWQAQSITSVYLWAEGRPRLDPWTCLPDCKADTTTKWSLREKRGFASWIFDFARLWGNSQGPICLMTEDLSEENESTGKDDHTSQIIKDITEAFPQLQTVRWTGIQVIRERRATPLRPRELWGKALPQTTPIANLVLAGDWLDPELPPTVEAAVRTGERAVKYIAKKIALDK